MKDLYIFLLALVVLSCNNKENTIEISEDSRFNPIGNKLVVPYSLIKEDFEKNGSFILLYKGKNICYQLDDLDSDGIYDELVSNLETCPSSPNTWVHFGKSSKRGGAISAVDSFTLYKDKLPKIAGFNLQTDGPTWENDIGGYRHYLDGRNGRDIFGKQKPEMILSEIGLSDSLSQTDNYHVLEEWGRDILSVGNSLGAGGLAIHDEGKIVRLGVTLADSSDNIDSTTFRIINRGPIRSIFSLNFYGWKLSEGKINIHQLIEIWPGDYYYTNRVSVLSKKRADTLVIGLVNNNNRQPTIEIDSIPGYFIFGTFDQQTYNREYYLGLAIAVHKDQFINLSVAEKEKTNIEDSYFIHLRSKNGQVSSFRVYSGWELQDTGFRERDYFIEKILSSFHSLLYPGALF